MVQHPGNTQGSLAGSGQEFKYMVVGKERLELSPREGLEPKSSASTNFATRPGRGMIPFELALSTKRAVRISRKGRQGDAKIAKGIGGFWYVFAPFAPPLRALR